MSLDPNALRFGIHSGPQNTELGPYVELWQLAEELGLDWASVFDHFLPIHSDPAGPCFEGLTLLSALAAKTSRLRCGILVVGSTYRNAAVLANIAATIDHVSNGRLELGIGAGWYELEHQQYGIPFPPIPDRLRRLRETAHVLKSLWTQPETTFEGEHVILRDARCEPKPVQKPHLPLWIGGTGERVLLRIVAEHADGWNTFVMPEDDYRRKLDALAGHCATFGRDPASVRKSLCFVGVIGETEAEAKERLAERSARAGAIPANMADNALVGTPEQVVERLEPFRALGVRDFIVMARPPTDVPTIELFAKQVAPALRAAG
jgi:F420-dependent oxidoreductase-like protein